MEDNEIYNVVQPDIFVVCDNRWKGNNNAFLGAPDMVIEILSPSNRKKDLIKKFLLYEKSGVREYWIADPEVKAVTTYILQQDGEYDDGNIYPTEKKVPVHIFGGHLIDVNDIFDF